MQSEGGFFTYQEGNQVLGSGLMGAQVRGTDNENIGSVDDLLLDRDGQILAVVVGVGGFLGIGQKNVAIANDQLQFVLAQEAAANDAANTGTGGTAATGGTATAPAAGTSPMTGTSAAPAETGAMGTAPAAGSAATGAAPATGTTAAPMDNTTNTAAATTGNETVNTGGAERMGMGNRSTGLGWTGAGIDHIQVNFTRQQLEDAPAFETAE
jgi:hypothetical protein